MSYSLQLNVWLVTYMEARGEQVSFSFVIFRPLRF